MEAVGNGYHRSHPRVAYWTSSRTPIQTRAAEIQRRRATFSCRKNLARMAEVMKVSEAEAGATRLASPQERAVSRQKKLKMRQASPRRKSFSRVTRVITASRPLRERSSSRSPMRFMAAESRTSPELEARTRVAMAIQSLSEFMLALLQAVWRRRAFDRGALRAR